MNITDYIVSGGENLNSPAQKTPSFPDNAERVFTRWHMKLGRDESEKENYFELPVDKHTRLYMKSFWEEKNGNRPLCYYVGFLLTEQMYLDAKEYYLLNKGLGSITLRMVLSAIKTFSPLPCPIERALPKVAIWTPFEELASMKLYGEKEFERNIDTMCFSLSVNNLDDWFSRLFIAVNPDRQNPAYHIVVSRRKPRPMIKDFQNVSSAPPKEKSKTAFAQNHGSFLTGHYLYKNTVWFIITIAVASILLNVYQWHREKSLQEESYENIRKLEQDNNKLSDENARLEKKLTDLTEREKEYGNNIMKLEQDIHKLSDENARLEKKLNEATMKRKKDKESNQKNGNEPKRRDDLKNNNVQPKEVKQDLPKENKEMEGNDHLTNDSEKNDEENDSPSGREHHKPSDIISIIMNHNLYRAAIPAIIAVIAIIAFKVRKGR